MADDVRIELEARPGSLSLPRAGAGAEASPSSGRPYAPHGPGRQRTRFRGRWRTMPPVAMVIALGTASMADALSQASSGREGIPVTFTVAFLNPTNGAEDSRIADQLARALIDLETVETLTVDIPPPGLDMDTRHQAVDAWYSAARAHLESCQAHVAISYSTLESGETRLYWTPHQDLAWQWQPRRFGQAHDFALPAVLAPDLIRLVRLLIVVHASEFRVQRDLPRVEALAPLCMAAQDPLAKRESEGTWAAEDSERARFIIGYSLVVLAHESGRTEYFRDAIAVLGPAAEERARKRAPLEWAAAQVLLGDAFAAVGERQDSGHDLQEAVLAYRAALSERTRERDPLGWAETQNALGDALRALGERQQGDEVLNDAMEAIQAAFQEGTRGRTPLEWAGSQNSLGNILAALGERRTGSQKLEGAATAFRVGLEEVRRERLPRQWAALQMNLANVLAAMAERETNTNYSSGAIRAYRAALEEYTLERSPLQWAGAQSGLGGALRVLGQREGRPEPIDEAVSAFRAALEAYTKEQTPLQWAATQSNLGNALAAHGALEENLRDVEEAIAAYRDEVFTPETAPRYRAGIQRNLERAERFLEVLQGAARRAVGPRDTAIALPLRPGFERYAVLGARLGRSLLTRSATRRMSIRGE